jgi:hypothetical protein
MTSINDWKDEANSLMDLTRKLDEINKECVVDKHKIADYFFHMTECGVQYELLEYELKLVEADVRDKKLSFYSKLTDQYE